ncbi:MAG: NUDIX domain-containing protein [Desulfobacteraceae bacterium]|jgi:ADP-ribose pyrophosphatase YjhB (NUDIX family)
MKREYPESPIVGVGGVIFDEDAVLLAKRGQEPGEGEWSLPGGVVELGERLVDALKREIWEEVRIEVEIGGLIRVLDRIIYDQDKRVRFHYVIADFWGWRSSGVPYAASDISDVRFVSLKALQKTGVHREVAETIHMAVKLREKKMKSEEGDR